MSSNLLPKSISTLSDQLAKLPGVGPKSASRLAFYLLNKPQSDIDDFADALKNLKLNLTRCVRCHNLSENSDTCAICQDPSRKQDQLCVVENLLDVIAIERTQKYTGLYHVLGGAIAPIQGIGPDELNIKTLFTRVKKGEITEVVIATNPNLEGDATAMYISKELIGLPDLKITRLAYGLPVGADIEYADEITLERAMEGRKNYN
jgi:recombination protein RecR